MKKLYIGAAIATLVIGSAMGYRYATGECPCAALMRTIKGGERAAPAPVAAPVP